MAGELSLQCDIAFVVVSVGAAFLAGVKNPERLSVKRCENKGVGDRKNGERLKVRYCEFSR